MLPVQAKRYSAKYDRKIACVESVLVDILYSAADGAVVFFPYI